MIRVNGETKLFGLIGDPVSGSLSPLIHSVIAEKISDNIMYAPFHVFNGHLKDALTGAHALNIRGLNITSPYKRDIIRYLSQIDNMASVIGAVNTLKYTENGYEGYNTDIFGIIRTLQHYSADIKGKTAVVFGSGGGAASAVCALCELGAGKIFIANRTMNNAEQLAKQFSGHYNINIEYLPLDKLGSIQNAATAIQATTLGFHGKNEELSPVFDLSFFEGITFVFDIIYNPWETVFLRDAKKFGCVTVNGFDMLIFQAVASYEIWRGKKFDSDFCVDLKNELILMGGIDNAKVTEN